MHRESRDYQAKMIAAQDGPEPQNPLSKTHLRMTEFQFQSSAPQAALSYKHIKTNDV
jgi:hypothetical protein